MGLDDFKTDNSSSSSESKSSKSETTPDSNNQYYDIEDSFEVRESPSNKTRWEQDAIPEWAGGSPSERGQSSTVDMTETRDLLTDYEWLSAKIREEWSVGDFMDYLNTYENVVLESLKFAVLANRIDLNEIPDYNGSSFKEKHIRWYIKMAIENKQFHTVPNDNTAYVKDDRADLPPEFTQTVGVEHSGTGGDVKDNSSDSQTGLESFSS